jgi:heme-degrading monooxygenase HmoA
MINMNTKFISVMILAVSPEDMPAIAREATLAMQRTVPVMHGFIEGMVMANEQKTEVLLVTQWDSKDSWSAAEWDDALGRTVSDLVEGSKATQYHTYEPITVVRAS